MTLGLRTIGITTVGACLELVVILGIGIGADDGIRDDLEA